MPSFFLFKLRDDLFIEKVIYESDLFFLSRKGSYVTNKHLSLVENDVLYHLGLSSADDLEKNFGDVKFICMGGTYNRMKALAEKISQTLDLNLPIGQDYSDITSSKQRYSMFKVGPVLAVTVSRLSM